MSLLSFTKNVDRGSYEKLSIRDSARSLKKYGSTSTKTATKAESYIKHFVSNSDTLQGIALKYNVTIEQIRRANKLWASDSLFLREFLLIPQPDNANDLLSPTQMQSTSSQSSLASSSAENLNQNRMSIGSSTRSSFDEENISDFLSKIDASIASTKEVVKKVADTGEYGTDITMDGKRKPQSRLKPQHQNNNAFPPVAALNTVVTVQQDTEEERNSKEGEDAASYTWPQKRKHFAKEILSNWKHRAGSYRINYNRF
ncbi:lysM and putative peptidoglycan-binding domain-containing protein 2 isoform X2 [Sitophilus oryzae]|nr:lysM and putative peptidoglycan-binding domain-containing protein 2 isoform X2 [Sitophilus oryzae]XP_030747160.1 lysM and putative peptidoglycan-binding domain-containing protein 2 isoform X2 [Sitophilus oryzae]